MHRRDALAAGLLAPALSGCAALAPPPMGAALRAQSPPALPRRHWLADTPFVAGDDELCGPAVLAAALAAAGQPVPLPVLQAQVYLPSRAGSLQAEMRAAPRRHAMLAVELPPRLDAVLALVAQGHPAALLLNLSLPIWPRWHYVLLTGYDLDAGTVRLHSGTQAHAQWDLVPLEATWARSGHWALAVLPPGQWPPQVDEAPAMAALLGLDRAPAPTAARVSAWASAAARWPQRLSITVGWAQALTEAGRGPEAEAVLLAWLAQGDSAVAWNNLAQLRLARGDASGAYQAATRAMQRARAAEPQWLGETEATLRAATPLP
ncbi:PA2778 family cysteine peptidase [Ideonella sp. 4Y11]|uniref:PA2778 family cysteine peptidase n=1 Tax=Ideonella aquatica TaxID=2824119 RepID=A0A940YKK4_9BURK|nr:PA2778 family cysteine peptidase [Ideonella aquatica]MBQ0957991.1 PA2778 family cysteine peptidase [Ideonella aquatica]